MLSPPLASQFVKYFGVALIGYVADFSSMIICKQIIGLNYLAAAAIGFLIGLAIVYLLSGKYVFGEPKIKNKYGDFFAFAIVGIVGLGILSILMWLLTGVAGVNYIVAKILSTVIVYVWNFFARRSLYES